MAITDYVQGSFMVALSVSLSVRRVLGSGTSVGKSLFWCQMIVIVTSGLSLTWVYPVADQLLGGRSYINLATHLMLVMVYAIFARLVTGPLLYEGVRPWSLRPNVFWISAAGAILSFILLGVDHTSRGLDDYMRNPLWSVYWVFSTLGLSLPAISAIPLLLDAARLPTLRPFRTAYRLMAAGYGCSILMCIAYAASWCLPSITIPREVLVSATQLFLALSLIAIPFVKHQRLNERARTRDI